MSTPTAQRATAHPYLVLATVLTAVFVQLLDISIVNVAIPSIQSDLGASFGQVQLVLAGYQLAFACMLITGARLGDIYGRKRLFLVGMTVFTLSSALCGLAPDAVTLVVARVVQGLGSGLMFPQVLAVIQVTIPAKERGKAFGIFGATIGLATILGPLLGGVIIRLNLGGTDWRGIFLVNIPVGIVAVVAALRVLPESRSPDAPRLDVPGAVLVAVGLFLLVYPLTEGRQKGWPLWIYLMLAASVPFLVGFVLLQRRKTRENRSPLLLMSLFGNRSFRAGLLLSSVFFLGIAPFFFTVSLYLQLGLGFTPLHSGLTTFPFAVGTAIASSRSDSLVKKIGTRVLQAGAGTLAVAMVGIIVAFRIVGDDLHSWQLAPVFFVAGLGLGLFVAPLTNLVLAGIQGREAGSASGVLSTLQPVGGALGVAVIGVILFGLLGSNASSAADETAGALRGRLTAAGLSDAAAQAASAQFGDCFVRRANAADPSRVPAGCEPRTDAPAAVTQAFAEAAAGTTSTNFRHATERALLFEVAVFLTAFFLVPLLPRVRREEESGKSAAATVG